MFIGIKVFDILVEYGVERFVVNMVDEVFIVFCKDDVLGCESDEYDEG